MRAFDERVCAYVTRSEVNWSKCSFSLATFRFIRPNDTWPANSGFAVRSMARLE